MSIAEKIKYQRKLHNITQNKLAKAIDTSRSKVNHWEHGNSTPSLEHIILLAYIFNVSIEYFIDPKVTDEILLNKLTKPQREVILTLVSCYSKQN